MAAPSGLRTLPKNFKLPVPELLSPEFVTDMSSSYDILRHVGSGVSDDVIEDAIYLQEIFDDMMLEVSYLSTEAPIPNGEYILNRDGEVYKSSTPSKVLYNVSLGYMSDISKIINSVCRDKRLLISDLETKYENQGGDSYYLSGIHSTECIRHYYAVVDNGRLYTYSYHYYQ